METAGPIRVVIANDHRLFQTGIRLILSAEEGIEVVGEAPNGLYTIDVVSNVRPDVLLLGITMSGMDGIESLMSIKERSPQTKARMLTTGIDEASIYKALKAGAKG